MYQKNYYYPHKIIYLLVLLFSDPMFLMQTLLFVYTLPCFHPYIIGAWSSSKRRRGDGVSQSRFGRWEMRWASKGGGGEGSGGVGSSCGGASSQKDNGLVNKKWDVPSQNIKVHKFSCQNMLQTTSHLLLCIF
jgi:hypothetical protein